MTIVFRQAEKDGDIRVLIDGEVVMRHPVYSFVAMRTRAKYDLSDRDMIAIYKDFDADCKQKGI